MNVARPLLSVPLTLQPVSCPHTATGLMSHAQPKRSYLRSILADRKPVHVIFQSFATELILDAQRTDLPTTYECSAPTPFSATDSSTCELPSYCDGTDVTCPDKVILPATTVCRPAAVAADKTASCPANSYKDPNTSCRPAVDLCDAPEVCTGGPACPPDLYEPPTICCRPAVFGADGSTCDNTEYCDGVTTACPADTPMPATAVCRPAADLCDVPERCSGTSDSCPPNQRNDDGYVYKCGLTCFLCAVHQNQLTLSSGTSTQAWNLGGCGIGACDNFVTLKWPDCTTQCINALCPNNKALSNSEIYSCVKSTGHWVCDYKLDGTAVDNGV